MVTAWHGRPASSPSSPPGAAEHAVDLEAVLSELLSRVVVKHRCASDLPPGSVRLDLDHGDNASQQRVSRLLVTATPSSAISHAEPAPATTTGDAQWRAHQLRLLTAAVAQAVDLIVYLPEGTSALRSLLEPSMSSDRYARLRPSPRQLDLAARCLREAGARGSMLDHALLPLVLPGAERGLWSIGQPVEPVGACWLADPRVGVDTSAYSLALHQARQAGHEQLHGRTGAVVLVDVDAHGWWQVVADPLGSAVGQGVGDGRGRAMAAGGLRSAGPAGP